MRVLVTGGAGFLGSHLCKHLVSRGDDVVCLDNFFTGSKENIEELIDNERFQMLEHDIIEPLAIDVDEIYNFACPASPVHYQFDAVKTMKTSVLGILNVLELAKKTGARVLQASTSEVYGDPHVHPQPESYWGNVNPIGVRACYDEGKRCAEALCFDYHRQHGVDIRVMRIFDTYGPKMSPEDGRVVSNFIVQALMGENLTIYGDGKQTRSFCYVDDLIDGAIKLMEQDDFIGPVNVGNPNEFTMLELAQKVIERTGGKSGIIFNKLPKDDPKQRRPDITLAKEKLSWEPHVILDEGLGKTIAYFEKKLKLET